ncbi:MAG: corrinoid protein [Deltaproteobacteria bacterium]|nr:corrinoid protein [Candidatus Zymogenaceae bacterium]
MAAARVSPEKKIDQRLLPVKEAIMDGDEEALKEVITGLLDEGYAARDILNDGMIGAMEVIGECFRTGELFIPDVLLAARAMNEGLFILEPYLAEGKSAAEEIRVLIGTVQGDMHDIGKNMVAIMLKGVGCEVKDIGINVTIDEFIRQVEQYNPHILGMSALLTTTMDQMKLVIDSLSERGIRDRVKVIVGGAPVNKKFADDIGADGYAADAGEAVSLVQRLAG